MNGFGCTPTRFINAAGRALLGQVPLQDPAGHQASTPTRRPTQIIGQRPRKLPGATCSARSSDGDFPSWTVQVQIMPEADADKTLVQPVRPDQGLAAQADYPLIEVGVLELNRNPENYFAEIEQAAFSPVERRAGHRLLARQDAAGAHLLLCRRASLPARHALRDAAGQPPKCARSTLPSRTARCASAAIDGGAVPLRAELLRRRRRGPAFRASRRCRSPATPTATTIATATTTTASRARCSG